MRVGIFSPNLDVKSFDQEALLDTIACALPGSSCEVTLVTSTPWAKQGQNADDCYVMAGSQKIKMRICRKLLRIMGRNRWIPKYLGYLSVKLCESEILETLLGCDPDILVSLDAEWGTQLSKLLSFKYPNWICSTASKERSEIVLNSAWRLYNPAVKVSIVLPTYNGAAFIRKSIDSCLGQSFKNVELIIVDDGSRDNVFSIVESYKDSRLKCIRHDQNRGLPEALNTGFRHSTGEYLTWTSDDNYYALNAIEEMVRFLHTYKHVDLVYAESYIIDEKDTCESHKILRTHPPDWLRIDDGIGACFLYKRKIYETVGDYNPKFFKVEDYEYWVRVWKNNFVMQRLLRPLYYYRFHGGTLTAKYRQEITEKVKLVKQFHGI